MGNVKTMAKLMLATCVVAAALFAGTAQAGDYYGGGYYGNPGYYGGGYGYGDQSYDPYRGSPQGYYRRDFYADFYQRYLAFLQECRQHLAFHRELRDLREETPYGYGDPYSARDQHQALRATHDLWHRDHPYATSCPSYGEYYNWARYRGGYNANGYSWGGYPTDYWRQ